MDNISFLIAKLQQLIRSIPVIKIRYEYDESFSNHIVEVEPMEVYHSNNDYKIAESDLSFEFSSKYPEEAIIFITSDDIVSISNPILEIEGDFYHYETFNWLNTILEAQPDNFIKQPLEAKHCGENEFALAA